MSATCFIWSDWVLQIFERCWDNSKIFLWCLINCSQLDEIDCFLMIRRPPRSTHLFLIQFRFHWHIIYVRLFLFFQHLLIWEIIIIILTVYAINIYFCCSLIFLVSSLMFMRLTQLICLCFAAESVVSFSDLILIHSIFDHWYWLHY